MRRRRTELGFLLAVAFFVPSIPSAAAVEGFFYSGGGGGKRSLLGFRETKGNSSFQCSPSGPCTATTTRRRYPFLKTLWRICENGSLRNTHLGHSSVETCSVC
ncbi:uncharacterized protein M6B38_375880 [Iris pallida]|uniref:Secreted protein n=1 Tax=Iris pallida TaxID=29817 RepID=A0AAX6GAR9_IRIPA|nr:uncharacterized protein M6B38_375880 [Iris pallida]